MDEAIDAIETSTKLFEDAGPEIKHLVSIVQSLQDLSDTPKAVRAVWMFSFQRLPLPPQSVEPLALMCLTLCAALVLLLTRSPLCPYCL